MERPILKKGITIPKPQQSFTAEFKHEAVQSVKTSNKPKSQNSRELGISDSVLYSWCKAAEAHSEEAFSGKGHQLPLEEEAHRLRRELERTQQERDILKKRPCRYATPMRMKILPRRSRGLSSASIQAMHTRQIKLNKVLKDEGYGLTF